MFAPRAAELEKSFFAVPVTNIRYSVYFLPAALRIPEFFGFYCYLFSFFAARFFFLIQFLFVPLCRVVVKYTELLL